MMRMAHITIVLLLVGVIVALAQSAELPSSIHPTFPLLDEVGANVLESDGPASAMRTCGQCHDTAYIESHGNHASAELREHVEPAGRNLEVGTAEWIRLTCERHVGGGPAAELNRALDDTTGWNWDESGIVELNCFLCHTPNPDNAARIEAIKQGNFRWASTATISNSDVVVKSPDGWSWNAEAFSSNGHVKDGLLPIKDPPDENCGLCHGLADDDPRLPVSLTSCGPEHWSTITTGQIFSSQRLSESAMNLAGKQSHTRAWDVHAERLVRCVDCHRSPNHPAYCENAPVSGPSHLRFKSRGMAIGEFLRRPSHDFSARSSAIDSTTGRPVDPKRRCESCHDSEGIHDWLPYWKRHMAVISCEVCHIAAISAPTHRQIDWTVVTPEGEPRILCRGIEGEKAPPTPDRLIDGFQPVLLPRPELGGGQRLLPHNMISSWYWAEGDGATPVPTEMVRDAYLSEGAYHPEILAALDQNDDRQLDESELRLDTASKVESVKRRLESLGLDNPRIVGEVRPYGIHHSVTRGEPVTRDCRLCHAGDSRLSAPFTLASYMPGGVVPGLVGDTDVGQSGELMMGDDGILLYEPSTSSAGLYVIGHDSQLWVTSIGIFAVILVLIGIFIHGGRRIQAHRRRETEEQQGRLKEIYIYTRYERFWHWLQAVAIIILILTGLELHIPDSFALFGFGNAVSIHSTLGFIVVINALFAAFYHFASGEIRQYLPEPKGFFSQAIHQARYYVRGIFRNERHPFEKTPERKLNPLQQITYLVILNILLPLQVLTGVAIWGAQRWPDLVTGVGGLTILAPIHTLGAWMFAAFLLMHIYLTTTGHSPMANMRAMIAGWETIEEHGDNES